MWFWAPWCPTYQREAPVIAGTARQHPDVSLAGVAALDDLPAMQSFVDRYVVGFFPTSPMSMGWCGGAAPTLGRLTKTRRNRRLSAR